MDEKKTNVGISYERKDVSMRLVVALLVGAGCVVVLMLFAIWQLFWAEERRQRAAKGSTEALAPLYPAEPRLEQIDKLAGVEKTDVVKRLAAQEKTLNSFGPTAEKGFAHIPIQQAIDAVAGKLPVRKQPEKGTSKRRPSGDGGANSGREIGGATQ
jgi:hypothetical protein